MTRLVALLLAAALSAACSTLAPPSPAPAAPAAHSDAVGSARTNGGASTPGASRTGPASPPTVPGSGGTDIGSFEPADTLPLLADAGAGPPATAPVLAAAGAGPFATTPAVAAAAAPAVPASLTAQMRAGFRLPHAVDQRRVQLHLAWFQRHPAYLERLAPRIEKYLPYVCEQVRERDLPAELCLLPVIESALDPFAFSPGGAAGLWQFIPGTAKRYGLKIDWWVDERRDPVAATDAALDYLESLHDRFGDWLMAVAAYNCGEARVARAMRRVGADADFFDLDLPRETASYVPRLLAFAAIVDDPVAHGVALPFEHVPAQPRHTAVVDTGGQIDVARAAEAIGLSVDEVYALNPGLNQWATHPRGPHRLLVPADLALQAQRALDAVAPDDRVAWIRHEVAPNQTLGGLALRYGTDVATLRRVNGLEGTLIRVGDHLMIPKSTMAANAYPTPQRARAVSGAVYVVQSGDSLWTIAKSFGTSTQSLMRANHIGPDDVLQIGQKIVVPDRAATTAASAAGRAETVRTVRYRVRSGDSLARIAGKFNVSIRQIAGWNGIDPNALLHPGQRLVLYVDVTAQRT